MAIASGHRQRTAPATSFISSCHFASPRALTAPQLSSRVVRQPLCVTSVKRCMRVQLYALSMSTSTDDGGQSKGSPSMSSSSSRSTATKAPGSTPLSDSPQEPELSSDDGSDGGSSDDGSSNGNNSDNGEGDSEGDGGNENSEEAKSPSPATRDELKENVSSKVFEILSDLSSNMTAFTTNSVSSISTGLSSWIAALLKTVPPPVMVALISLTSTFFGSRYRAAQDAKSKEAARVEAGRKRKAEVEQQLRLKYEEFATPILNSAAKLAHRLEMMVNVDWASFEDVNDTRHHSALYSAFLLGRFLAHVEILKRERPLLDYGFPMADRILTNILGRVQGVLAASDRTLANIQNTEQFFKPYPGDIPAPAGVLKLSPKTQAVLGQLLLRKSWESAKNNEFLYSVQNTAGNKRSSKSNSDVPAPSAGPEHGSKAVLTFLEFSILMKRNKEMQYWYHDVVRDFRHLEKVVRRTRRKHRRNKTKRVGSRVFFLQSALLDLVEFFDPLPHPRSIAVYERKRLEIGPHSYKDSQRSPPSLYKLYGELAQFREYRQHGNPSQRLALPNNSVEVFVTGGYYYDEEDGGSVGADGKTSCSATDQGRLFVESCSQHTNCPYTHRVMIALSEMGIPHQTITISPNNKPPWYYLLHPMTQTPVIYHNGDVVSDSSNIVSYLTSPKMTCRQRSLASAASLKLARGTDAFTAFHRHFLSWAKHRDPAHRRRLETDLRRLDVVLRYAQITNEGQPFFGGATFSREDTAIVPMLHFVDVAGRAAMQWSIPPDCKAVRAYLEAARQQPSFAYPGAEEQAVMQRFNAHVDSKEARTERLADVLE